MSNKKKPKGSRIRHMVFQMMPDDDGLWHHLPDEREIYAIIKYHRAPDVITGRRNLLEIEWEET
jgi:hypothetical protein